MNEEEARKLLQDYFDMVKKHVDAKIDQVKHLAGQVTERFDAILTQQVEVIWAARFLKDLVPPSVHDILVAAGWTPPEGGKGK